MVEQVVVGEGNYFGRAQRRKDPGYELYLADELERALEGDLGECWSSREFLEDEGEQEEDLAPPAMLNTYRAVS